MLKSIYSICPKIYMSNIVIYPGVNAILWKIYLCTYTCVCVCRCMCLRGLEITFRYLTWSVSTLFLIPGGQNWSSQFSRLLTNRLQGSPFYHISTPVLVMARFHVGVRDLNPSSHTYTEDCLLTKLPLQPLSVIVSSIHPVLFLTTEGNLYVQETEKNLLVIESEIF